jgi:hypothetical protein
MHQTKLVRGYLMLSMKKQIIIQKYKILTQKCENVDNTSEKLFKYQYLGQSLLLADPKH